MNDAVRIGAMLKQRGQTLGVSESSTGGLVSAAILAVPGSSAWFMGGAVVYTLASRTALLGLTAADMQGIRSASEPYALLCASRIRARLGTDWGIAETGAAGPAGNRYGDAPGHSCLAISGPVERVITLETASADRVANMRRFADRLLALLAETLDAAPG